MAWPPPSTFPVEPPPVVGWWVELSYNRLVARGLADIRAREQEKRRRRNRRRVERIDEARCLMESASEVRRTLHRQGIPYESRSAGPDEVEHFTRIGRILSVR